MDFISITEERSTAHLLIITGTTEDTFNPEIPSEERKSLGTPRGYEWRRGGEGSMPERLVRLTHSLTNLDSTEAAWMLIGQVAVLGSSVD